MTGLRWSVVGMAACIVVYTVLTSPRWNRKPLPPAARPVAHVDTVWMGVTHVETMDGTVVVKFTEVKSTRHTLGKETKP
jgi:hypothetical protein